MTIRIKNYGVFNLDYTKKEITECLNRCGLCYKWDWYFI